MYRMTQVTERFENWCVSAEIRAVPTQHSKARLILGICLFFTPLMVAILGVAWWSLPDSRDQTVLILVGHLLMCTSALSLRWSKSVLVPGTVFMACGTIQLLTATYLTGSVVSPVVYAFPVLVVFAATVSEFRVAVWTAAVLLLGAVLIWLPEYPDYNLFTEHGPLHIRALILAWAMTTAIGVAWLYTVEAKHSESKLLDAIDDRDSFVAYLSHELRNPLTAIIGAADLLSTDTSNNRNAGLLEALHRSALGMTQVLDDVLDVSQGDAGMLDLQLAPTPARQVAEGALSELGAVAATADIQLHLDFAETGEQHVWASQRRLEQVLRNLISNSLKFTDSGGQVTLRVRLEGSGAVLFEVIDTGIGIEKDQLETILMPFRQAKRGSSNGVGLGLPISNLLLGAMGSEIKIKSTPGEGSSFSFSLPPATPDLGNRTTSPGPKTVVRNLGVGDIPESLRKVLLVDDNDDARQVMSELLERLSCEVETAKDGVQALEVVGIRPPQVLLLDLQMPRLGGVATAKEIRRRFSTGELLPFSLIAVTGNADTQNSLIQEGLFNHVMIKPVGLAQLEAGLCQVLSEQEPTD